MSMQAVLKLFEKSHEAITTDQIISTLKITKSRLYSIIYGINHNKKSKIEIKSIDHKYVVLKKLDINCDTKDVDVLKNMSISNDFVKKIKSLSESDKNDVIDMLKKSHFYRKSAEALVEANEELESLKY
jgi:hypothetical protein